MRPERERSIRRRWKAGFDAYVERYIAFARMRGFNSEINDWPYVRRSFLECWAEPGFHRFWRVWNPGIAYFVYRLYLRLGGNRRRAFATVSSFLVCGLVHTLVVVPFAGRWAFSVVVAFGCFALLALLSLSVERVLKQQRWPWPANALLNVTLVCASFDFGFRVDRWLGL